MRFILVIPMAIGFLMSLTNTMPNPLRAQRRELFRQQLKLEEVIECKSKDFVTFLIRLGFLFIMLISTVEIAKGPSDTLSVVLLTLAYVLCFGFHYPLFIQTDRKYYFTEKGFWIGRIREERHPYEDIKSSAVWMSKAGGSEGNLNIRMKVGDKRYTAVYVNKARTDGEEEANQKAIEKLIEWVPNTAPQEALTGRKLKLQRTGRALMAVGIIATFLFGGFLFYNMDSFGLRTMMVTDGEVRSTEQGTHSTVDFVDENANGLTYVFYGDMGTVNVYDDRDEFKYAYCMPKSQGGDCRILVKSEQVYVKDGGSTVYIFQDDEFIKHAELDDLDEALSEEIQNAQTTTALLAKYSGKQGFLDGDRGMAYMFVSILIALFGYGLTNKARYGTWRKKLEEPVNEEEEDAQDEANGPETEGEDQEINWEEEFRPKHKQPNRLRKKEDELAESGEEPEKSDADPAEPKTEPETEPEESGEPENPEEELETAPENQEEPEA